MASMNPDTTLRPTVGETGVAVCLDCRPSGSRLSPRHPAHDQLPELVAVERVLSALPETPHPVRVAAVSDDGLHVLDAPTTDSLSAWIERHPDRQAPSASETGVPAIARAFQSAVPRGSTVVFVTPLLDGTAETLCLWLHACEYDLTVVSPAHSAAPSRAERLRTLRKAGVPVLDWDPGTPIELPGS